MKSIDFPKERDHIDTLQTPGHRFFIKISPSEDPRWLSLFGTTDEYGSDRSATGPRWGLPMLPAVLELSLSMADMEPSATAREGTNHEDNQCTDEIETNAADLSEGERDDTEDDDGGDWFIVARKRRQPARQSPMATTMTTGPARSSNQEQARKPRLPPLPMSDYKVVLRPREGLNFGKWQSHHVARAVGQSARLIATEFQALTLRIRGDQNIAVASTPNEELADRIRQIKSIQLGDTIYQVTAYVAAPDRSCKGVVTGIDSGTHSDELMTNLRSPRAPILYARMLGKSKAALITFDSLEVPRAIYYYGGEL